MSALQAMRCTIPSLAWALCLVPLVEAQTIPPLVDEAFANYAALPAKLIPILSEAQDKDTADAAAAKLHDALPSVYDARSALHRIPSLGKEETALVQQKYETRLRREWGKLFEQIYRLQKTQCYGSLTFFRQFQLLCLMLEK